MEDSMVLTIDEDTLADHPKPLGGRLVLLKQLQEDEWHRQWAERNNARYQMEMALSEASR
jgi:hypothetical protein